MREWVSTVFVLLWSELVVTVLLAFLCGHASRQAGTAYASKLLWLWVEPVSSLREKPVWNQEKFTIVFGAGQIDGRAGTQALEGE
jgi:hypothetical protein